MQRRNFPLILLYGFGLALTLSLLFNGFLLYEQRHHRSIYEYDLGNSVNPVDLVVWQEQLANCQRANQQKDSLISRLVQVNALPSQAASAERTASK